MEIRNIKSFVQICADGSFSRAAKNLGYAQSSVTAQIQQLEEGLGVQLFERINKRVYLTAAGSRFLEYASDVLQKTRQITERLQNARGVSGNIRIGCYESIGVAFLPSVLETFARKYPSVSLTVVTGSRRHLAADAKANRLDLVWNFEKEEPADIFSVLYEKEYPLSVVCKKGLAGAEITDRLARLDQKSFIFAEAGCQYRGMLTNEMSGAGVRPKAAFEIDNTEIIRNLRRSGLGFAFLPDFLTEADVRRGKLERLRLSDFSPVMYSRILVHKNKAISSAISAFLQTAKEIFP